MLDQGSTEAGRGNCVRSLRQTRSVSSTAPPSASEPAKVTFVERQDRGVFVGALCVQKGITEVHIQVLISFQ